VVWLGDGAETRDVNCRIFLLPDSDRFAKDLEGVRYKGTVAGTKRADGQST